MTVYLRNYGGFFMNKNELTERGKVSIEQLKKGKVWTNWEWYTKGDKKTKKPISKVNEPNTWITYEQAQNNSQWGELGIGIMFAPSRSGLAICGIDIDAHKVEENPLAKEILTMFSDTYIERSPSGKGYHILFLAELNKLPNEQTYKSLYKQKNSELDVECYISGLTNRYFTFTGNKQSNSDYLTNKTDTLFEFLEKYMKKSPLSVNLEEQLKLTEGGRETTTIDIAKRLETAMNAANGNLFTSLYNGDTSGYSSTSEAVQAFMDMLVFYFGEGGAELVTSIYMQSAFAQGEKWGKRKDIIQASLENAFKRVSERYTPPQARQLNSKKKLTEGRRKNPKRKQPLENFEQFAEFIEKNGYSIKYNQITHNFEFFGFDNKESPEHLAETVPSILQDKLKESFSCVSKQNIIDYITRYATQHRFNPVLELIKETKWDGTDRIIEIYNIFSISEEDKLSRLLIKKWLMQCVCGLFNDIQNAYSLDIILVFQGKQGIGKTRFFEKLALKSKFFAGGFCLDPRNRDSIMQATSKWICELGEIGSTMKKDMDSVKAFITNATDEYRTPYGRASLLYPRITSFVGTVNDTEFLIDQTGNRRFATVPLKLDLNIDYETQIKPFNALQLWAEIYEIVKNKEKSSCFRLTNEEKRQLEIRNTSFVKPLKGECEVLDILEEQQTPEEDYTCTFKEMTVTEFIKNNNLKYDARTVGKILSKYGYESKQRKLNGTPTRVIRLPYKYYSKYNDIP